MYDWRWWTIGDVERVDTGDNAGEPNGDGDRDVVGVVAADVAGESTDEPRDRMAGQITTSWSVSSGSSTNLMLSGKG